MILVVALAEQAAPGAEPHPWWRARSLIAVVELAGGAAIGLAVGWLRRAGCCAGSPGLVRPVLDRRPRADRPRLRRGRHRCTPRASSPSYLAALVLGNTRLPHRPAVRGFAEALGWLAQIGLFVLLGPAGHARPT